jgi:hypothetical protein
MEKAVEKRYSPRTEAFYRRHILPEEEKTFPTTPGHGYRWFRSENVTPLSIIDDQSQRDLYQGSNQMTQQLKPLPIKPRDPTIDATIALLAEKVQSYSPCLSNVADL